MRLLQIRINDLIKNGFSRPAMASSYFPATVGNTHIHVGISTQNITSAPPIIAEEGNVFITFISFKNNDKFWFKLIHNPLDGYFSFPPGKSANDLSMAWRTALRGLGIVRGI